MTKWNIWFYPNIPLDFMANAGVPLGSFKSIPMFAYQDSNNRWYFEIYTKGENNNEVLADCMEEIHERLDKISLHLMREVILSEIVVFNISEIFEEVNKKLVKIPNEQILKIEDITNQKFIQKIFRYPSEFSSPRGTWLMTPYQINVGATIATRITDTKIEKTDLKALRWFVKALGSNNEVDRFTSYVTSLDILSHKKSLQEIVPLCVKCKKPIDYTHKCGQKFVKQAYAKDYLLEFGIEESNTDKINKLRNKTLHGRKYLTSTDMGEFLDVNVLLIRVLAESFKKILNIGDSLPPILSPAIMLIDQFCFEHSKLINQEIFNEIKSDVK